MGSMAADEEHADTQGLVFWTRMKRLSLGRTGSAIRVIGFDEYVSDPAHPVPYRQRPIQPTYFPGGSKWSTWLVEDQRFVDDRADVLSWETPPLDGRRDDRRRSRRAPVRVNDRHRCGLDRQADRRLSGEQSVELERSPAIQLMVSNEVFRGRYRTSFEKPAPIEPNKVLEYTWSLHTQNYTFKKGHRIMVQVQSTWFPIIDRNPQTFVPNIFQASGERLQGRDAPRLSDAAVPFARRRAGRSRAMS